MTAFKESPTSLRGRLELQQLSVAVGAGSQRFDALFDLSFEIPAGQFVCVLGPSGCGKSTLLGALAGHLRPSAGQLLLDGGAVVGAHPDRGLVFQQHTLFPWKKAIDNVAFGLKMKGVGRSERRARAQEMLDLVGLAGFEYRYPAQLSGGMQQRVEIARVLINDPRVLLMDEPFGALDAQMRLMMQELLLDVWSQVRTTVLFVTHDIDEAVFLSDRIVVLSRRPGRVLDDIPVAIDRPRNGDVLVSKEFVRIKRRCLDLIRDEHQHVRGAPVARHVHTLSDNAAPAGLAA